MTGKRRLRPEECCVLCGQPHFAHNVDKCKRKQKRRHTSESEMRDKQSEHRDMIGQKLADGFDLMDGVPERDSWNRKDEDE